MARSRFETFAKDLQLATADLAPEKINGELAKFARRSLAEEISAGNASTIYTKFVNGREGAEEETVQVPGAIVYEFSYWGPIISFALAALEKRSPKKTGAYIKSHVVMIGSQVISPTAEIAAGEEVAIVATVPYSRKIEVGGMRMSVPDGVFQDVRRLVQSQFGRAVEVRFKMITIPGGYVLKGRFRRGYKPFARRKIRPDTAAGAIMTYPSLQMRMK